MLSIPQPLHLTTTLQGGWCNTLHAWITLYRIRSKWRRLHEPSIHAKWWLYCRQYYRIQKNILDIFAHSQREYNMLKHIQVYCIYYYIVPASIGGLGDNSTQFSKSPRVLQDTIIFGRVCTYVYVHDPWTEIAFCGCTGVF